MAAFFDHHPPEIPAELYLSPLSDSYDRERYEHKRAKLIQPVPLQREEVWTFADAHAYAHAAPPGHAWTTTLKLQYGMVRQLEQFARTVIKARRPLYASAKDLPVLEKYISHILPTHQYLRTLLGLYRPDMRFSPPVQAMFDAAIEMGLLYAIHGPDGARVDSKRAFVTSPYIPIPLHMPGGSTATPGLNEAQLVNKWVGKFQAISKSPSYARELKTREATALANLKKVRDLASALFQWRAVLRVESLELGYVEQHAFEIDDGKAKADLRHLLRNQRSNPNLFEGLGGYVWRLEKGTLGWYHRLWMLFDAQATAQKPDLAHQIGKYWCRVTEGWGAYNNSSEDFRPNFALGLGEIHIADSTARSSLDKLFQLITKKDTILKPKISGNIFGTSWAAAADDHEPRTKRT